MIDRQVTNDVSLFESQVPFNPLSGKLIIDPKRAVKKFRRSAAGNYELSEDLRPPEVLLATTVYLMKEVLGDERWPANGIAFAVLYAFIRDRLRAIRTDLTLQSCKNLASIRIHELSIRFLIAAGHLLCEDERAAFEPQQNNEQLNGCLSALREMYKSVRLTNDVSSGELLKYEAEFQAYSIILSVDKKEAAVAISALPMDLLQSQAIQVALEAYSAFQQTNFIKFLALICHDQRTSYLQACLLHQFVVPVRQRALSAMAKLPDSYKTVPRTDFIRWLAFVDETELAYYSDRFGFKINVNFVDLTSLIQRGEAYDLRAEEETFKLRKFQTAIEDSRRGGAGLSEIMFSGFDLDLKEVMRVLEVPSFNKSGSGRFLTSEFLAASTGSPLPASKAKKFFTSKSADEFKNAEVASSFNAPSPFPMFSAPTIQTATVSTPIPAPVPQIDHKALLRKKLEAQAQERQVRKDQISVLSEGMLDALLDSVVGVQVAESCTVAWDLLWNEQRSARSSLVQELSVRIFQDLIDSEILPTALDIELMRIKCRAVDSLNSKNNAINQSTFAILNSLESEIYEEVVRESLLEYTERQFVKRKWFMKMAKRSRSIEFDWSELFKLNFDFKEPVHIVFAVNNDDDSSSRILDQLVKARPPNPLGYLQTFLRHDGMKLKMLWSGFNAQNSVKVPFILSSLEVSGEPCIDLFKWPANYPGPTVLITNESVLINANEFLWQPEIVKVDYKTATFHEIFDYSMKLNVNLPGLNSNLVVSQLIPMEFIESFVQSNDDEELLGELMEGLVDRIIWTLFKSPQASRLLSWHPVTAGRSLIIDSIKKSHSISSSLSNLYRSSHSLQSALTSLDQIYGPLFTCNLEQLYTTQSISEIIRNQNEIVSRFEGVKRMKSSFDVPQSKRSQIEVLNEKLKTGASESEAYELFLKKFL